MGTKEKITRKFEALLIEGDKILRQAGWNGRDYKIEFPDSIDYRRFRAEASNLIQRVCGRDSDHHREIKKIADDPKMTVNSFYFKDCYGILQAAKNDYEHGMLFDLRSLVAAELLGDFLEQAEYLFSEGYINPAASLAGAVLEDGLRKLCAKHNFQVPQKTTIGNLNATLAKAQIYNQLVQKRITTFADIRNNSDHGHFDQYNKDDVGEMISGIRRFLTDQLG